MNKQNLNPWVYFFITFFAGWLGGHKFVDKQAGMGILYLLTGGLFGIGWLIDSIKALINAIKYKPTAATTNYNAPSVTSNYEKSTINKVNLTVNNEERSIFSKIKGVTFPCVIDSNYNRQELIPKLNSADVLKYKKYLHEGEPAIMLLNDDGIDLGFISKDLAATLYDEDNLTVIVAEVTGDEDTTYGCNIEILY